MQINKCDILFIRLQLSHVINVTIVCAATETLARVNDCYLFSYGRPLYFCPVVSFFYLLLPSSFFPSPNLSGRRLDVYHTLTHGVALVRI